jgi:hypothetical protein
MFHETVPAVKKNSKNAADVARMSATRNNGREVLLPGVEG